MTATTALAINISLMVIAFALWTGIPLWMVLKRPDRKPARAVPQYRRAHAAPRSPVGAQAWHVDRLRFTGR